MNDFFLETILGPLLAILVFAIIATPIILISSVSRKESLKDNIKKYFRILVKFIENLLKSS